MLRHVRLTTLVALFVIVPAVAVAAAPFAYVTNSGSASVSVIDLATSNGVSSISLPGSVVPWGVALNRAGTRLYVTNQGNSSVFVIDTAASPPSLLATVTWPTLATVVPKQPLAVAVNPAGTRVYVSFFRREGSSLGGAVSVFDATTNTILATVAVGQLNEGIAVHPDGTRVYVASSFSNSVIVLDAITLAPLRTITAGLQPFGLAFNQSGSLLFVTNNGSNSVSRIDTGTDTVNGEVFVGVAPIGIALSPDETRAYVANNGSVYNTGSISVVDTATMTPAAPDIAVGGAPYGVDVAADGRIFVANSTPGSITVWVIDPVTLAVSTRTVGNMPVAFGNFIHRPTVVYQFTWRTSGGTATAGSTIPVRWSVTDANGNAVDSTEAITSITSAEVACAATASVAATDQVKAKFAGSSDLRYDSASNQFVFNWKTEKAWAGQCRQFVVQLKDGTSPSLTFQFR